MNSTLLNQAITLLFQGMGGIFLVILLIMGSVYLLNKLDQDSKKE